MHSESENRTGQENSGPVLSAIVGFQGELSGLHIAGAQLEQKFRIDSPYECLSFFYKKFYKIEQTIAPILQRVHLGRAFHAKMLDSDPGHI